MTNAKHNQYTSLKVRLNNKRQKPVPTYFLHLTSGFQIASLVGPLLLAGLILIPLAFLTSQARAGNCVAGCRVWTDDGCNTCTCINGRVGSCTKRLCNHPRQKARCIDPPNLSHLDPASCRWDGTAPFCRGSCPMGTFQVTRDRRGDGKKCRRGSKAYCCPVIRTHGGLRPENCYYYAKGAIEQRTIALNRGCNFSGPVWDPNFDAHYNWCMRQNNIEVVRNGANLRSIALANGSCP